MKDYSTAFLHCRKGLELRQQSLPSNHPVLVESYKAIGGIYGSIGQYPVALSCFQKTLEISKISLPSNHLNRAMLHSSVAITNEHLHCHEEVIQHALEGINIATTALGPTHSQVQILRDQLEN
jgi:tetratricopeptide (TPR) repeat protein